MNNYNPYYLKFQSKEEADIVLEELNYLRSFEQDSETITYYTVGDVPGGIDIVGEIWNDDGEYEINQETGEVTVIKEATKKDGWHVNIILSAELPETLQDYVVEPETPSRRFAGF